MVEKNKGVRAFTLDGLIKAAGESTTVINLKELETNNTFVVVTQDEVEYDITVLESQTGLILVKGGQFTKPTECKLNGSTFGGSMLWMDRIVIGMCMEFFCKGIVLTPPVKIIGWRIDPSIVSSKTIN